MLSRLLTTLSIILGLSSAMCGQQAACKTAEIPVGVISINGDLFRGLAPEDFVGRIQKKPVTVKTITYDDGPRRVLLVVDANKKLSADTRKAEGEMVKTLLASARPEDTFGLLYTHGHGAPVKFTKDRAAIPLAFGGDGSGGGKEPGVLDSVMEGIQWFETPQPGDAIVVIAADMEGNHKANPKMVAKALEERQIRMFGLSVGPVTTRNSVAGGTMTSTTSQGMAYTTPLIGDMVYDTGDENFFPLTVNSGGLLMPVINMDSRRTYSMENPRMLQEVRQKAHAVSKMITAYYRVQIDPSQFTQKENWNLTINQEIQKHAQPMFVLFPHALGPC